MHVGDRHVRVDRLGHVVDGERRRRCGHERLHLDACPRGRLRDSRDLHPVGRDVELDVDQGERQRVAERDQLTGALGGHDPRHLRSGEGVSLRELPEPPGGVGPHGHARVRDGPPP